MADEKRWQFEEHEDGWRLMASHTGEILQSSDPLVLIGYLLESVCQGEFGDERSDLMDGLRSQLTTAALLFAASTASFFAHSPSPEPEGTTR